MAANQSTHHWLSRFCVRLMELDKSIDPQAAVRRAVSAFPYSDDMAPEAAAQMFAASPRNAKAAASPPRYGGGQAQRA